MNNRENKLPPFLNEFKPNDNEKNKTWKKILEEMTDEEKFKDAFFINSYDQIVGVVNTHDYPNIPKEFIPLVEENSQITLLYTESQKIREAQEKKKIQDRVVTIYVPRGQASRIIGTNGNKIKALSQKLNLYKINIVERQ